MTLYRYQIPDKHFAPHKVVVPFIARVAYEVMADDSVKIIEVALSESACKYVRTGEQFMNEIREEIERKVLGNVDETVTNIVRSFAPFI